MFFIEDHRIKTWWLLCLLFILSMSTGQSGIITTLKISFWVFQSHLPATAKIQLSLVILVPLLLLLLWLIITVYNLSKYVIRVSNKNLCFGYSSFITEVPISSIQKVTFEKMGFWRSIGMMLYINQGIRLNQAVSFGTGVKIDCENGKKYFFSVKNPEEIRKILISLLGEEKVLTA